MTIFLYKNKLRKKREEKDFLKMGRGNHCEDCKEMTGECAAAGRQMADGHQRRRGGSGGGPTVFQTFLVVYLFLIPTVLSLNACRYA